MILGGEEDAGVVRGAIREVIGEAEGTAVDYVSVADPESLEELDRVTGPTLLAVAVKIGPARLIDNRVVSPP